MERGIKFSRGIRNKKKSDNVKIHFIQENLADRVHNNDEQGMLKKVVNSVTHGTGTLMLDYGHIKYMV